MSSNGPATNRPRTSLPSRHGFSESHSENMLRDSVLFAAALVGTRAVLVLRDESGTWHRDSSGLSSEQLAAIEPAFVNGPLDESGLRILEGQGLQLVEALPLVDRNRRIIGMLGALSPEPVALTVAQREGLKLVADHIQTIVAMEHQKTESRNAPRAPAAASFVPGLVHELGGFVFGISANLDAFEARFADMEEVTKYGAHIRRSLERMRDFIVELKEYGDPHRLSWSNHDLEPLLREAIEGLGPAAAKKDIQLRLDVAGTLPPIHADDQGLVTAFMNVINMVLQQEEPGGEVTIHVAANHPGEGETICGHVDCSNLRFKDVDPARLFEPFYFRVSGLGRLALPGARRVFESHGGTLTAGPGPAGGMRIHFRLPSSLNESPRPAGQP